jgi:hypothetical protein
VARSHRSSHSQFQSNAKSPDVPGAVDIAMPGADVSHMETKKAVEGRRKAGQDGRERS